MFCPTCAAEMPSDLNYCKRCGGPNPLALQKQAPVNLTTPIIILGITAAVITLGGLLLLYAVLSRMLEPGKPIFPEQLIPIVLAFASVIIVADFFLLRLISQLVNARLEAGKVAPIPARPVSQLSSAQMSLPPVAPGQDAGERTTALFVRSPTEPAREEPTKPLE